MSENPYKYLFPFEQVPAHSRILIYGAGILGQDYLRQMQMTRYCQVAAVADKNYEEYPPMTVPVIAPERIHEFSFDYAVVALRGAAAWNEVRRVLKREGVAEERIVCVFERTEPDTVFRGRPITGETALDGLACAKSRLSVALLVTGGFGDMVIQKRLVMELIRLAPGCAIDMYAIKETAFLEHLYSDCEHVNRVLADLGGRYQENHKRYVLALMVEACHFIRVDGWNKEGLDEGEKRQYEAFIRRMDRLKEETEVEGAGINTPVHLATARRLYLGLDAYSGFNYNGAFSIADKRVPIPLDRDWEPAFEALGLGTYVTFNFGNGACADGSRIAKSWSRDGFERVISLFRQRYPEMGIVQLGAGNAERLSGAGRYMFGADFRLVIPVLKHSMLHVDIEGGLVHIATQLGTKCVVLFGPTVMEYYGYEQNINIRAGNCHSCYGLYPDMNRCARGMREPECMRAITPELVVGHVEGYMESVLRGEAGVRNGKCRGRAPACARF